MKHHVAVVVLLAVLLVLASFPQIEDVKAQGAIYIREDGSVEGTDKILQDGDVYTLTDSIYNSTITVLKDDVVLDGAGHTLQGQPNGIVLGYRDNVTIKNFIITTSSTSDNIYVYYCTNCKILNNIITPFIELFPGTGIDVWGGSSNVIAGNQIMNNLCGIHLGEGTSNNSIIGNSITNNTRGVQIQNSQNTSIYNNNFNNKLIEVHVVGGTPGTTLVIYFDNGTTGNHWNNYEGTDADGDGIGDTQYFVADGYQDNYPLVEPVVVISEFSSWIFLVVGLFAVTVLSIGYRQKFKQGEKR